ncbi:MAG: DUF134 domain-containing protein [Asgard group archaeon]|nr:DUF134 domain-containing protein [Asgard group archaeon]
MRNYRFRGGRRERDQSKDLTQIGRGRPLKEIVIEKQPDVLQIIPKPKISEQEIELTLGEYEALRLVDFEGLNQEEAGEKMHISRGTIWRLLDSGRSKLMSVIIEGKTLRIESKVQE